MLELPEWLYEYLMKLSKESLVEIMADALDQMAAWNGRTVTYCIVSSITGATITETETGHTYQLPKI